MIELSNTEAYSASKTNNDSWIVEAIWGHRIERQPFSALLLEFLGMAEGLSRKNELLKHTTPKDNPTYSANRCLQLRNILFNNPQMEEILLDSQGDDESAWEQWLSVMKRDAAMGNNGSVDFGYLRTRFDTFEELVNVVRLLRNIAVDAGSERRWTMQFIFPIGPAALYEALYHNEDGFEPTRRVFTRTGEIAYLMLTRCSEPVREKIKAKLAPSFRYDEARNGLLMRLISDEEPDRGPVKGGTYLPYKMHPAYERMGEDLAAILELNLPDQDSYQYIQPLLGFHIYLYGIETANYWIGNEVQPPIICEILAPKSDLVRKSAISSYLENDSLGSQAVKKYIDKTIFSDLSLKAHLANEDIDESAKKDFLVSHLHKIGAMPDAKKKLNDPPDSTTFIRQFYNSVDQYYRNYAAAGFAGLGAGCGLISRRGTNRNRYAPTDELLRALVFANVDTPMEEAAFLRRLYKRYRLVIGPVEAKEVVRSTLFDETDFKKNRDRFVQHLIGMGLAQRMSDACTYVLNPMGK